MATTKQLLFICFSVLLVTLLYGSMVCSAKRTTQTGSNYKMRRGVKSYGSPRKIHQNILRYRKKKFAPQTGKINAILSETTSVPTLGQKFKVISTLNLRSTPCTDQPVIGQLQADQTVFFTGQVEDGCGYTWYSVEVNNANKQTGWLASDFLIKVIAGDQGSAAGLAAALYAKQQVGKGESSSSRMGPDTFDSAGLVYKAYEFAGKTIVSTMSGYYQQPPLGLMALPGQKISDIQIGDLLWSYDEDTVGIYVGDNTVVVAGYGSVRQYSLNWYKNYVVLETIFRVV